MPPQLMLLPLTLLLLLLAAGEHQSGLQSRAPVDSGNVPAIASSSAPSPAEPELRSVNTMRVLGMIERLETTPHEDQEIAVVLLRHLEEFHDRVAEDLRNDSDADHGQMAVWAVDADRLRNARLLLESVQLE